jgi:hypothetical protein
MFPKYAIVNDFKIKKKKIFETLLEIQKTSNERDRRAINDLT